MSGLSQHILIVAGEGTGPGATEPDSLDGSCRAQASGPLKATFQPLTTLRQLGELSSAHVT